MTQTPALLVDGLCFAEGPRWRDGKLWFSDMHGHKVCTVDIAGNLEVIVAVPKQPSGLGWLPDGRLLIVSMLDRKLLVYSEGVLSEFADLSQLASYHCNDMVVAPSGHAYIGNFGFDIEDGSDAAPAELIMVGPGGEATVVAHDLSFPNGMVITADNKTLIVGETMASQLTAFDIEQDGSLSNRRTWAQLDGAMPDGICLDEAGGIWVASPISDEVLRVVEGGEVTDRIKLDAHAIACTLGGPDNRSLFILSCQTLAAQECRNNRDAKIEVIEVTFAGAGSP
jgi:sugar lactone lactonase YvrE